MSKKKKSGPSGAKKMESERAYWSELVAGAANYAKFYHIPDQTYKSVDISVDSQAVSEFLKRWKCPPLAFYGSVFALYLARVNRSAGTLLYTRVPGGASGEAYKKTLLKIDVSKSDCFLMLPVGPSGRPRPTHRSM